MVHVLRLHDPVEARDPHAARRVRSSEEGRRTSMLCRWCRLHLRTQAVVIRCRRALGRMSRYFDLLLHLGVTTCIYALSHFATLDGLVRTRWGLMPERQHRCASTDTLHCKALNGLCGVAECTVELYADSSVAGNLRGACGGRFPI
jgi:hypothetical protein